MVKRRRERRKWPQNAAWNSVNWCFSLIFLPAGGRLLLAVRGDLDTLEARPSLYSEYTRNNHKREMLRIMKCSAEPKPRVKIVYLDFPFIRESGTHAHSQRIIHRFPLMA